jgi:hypothetical protein
MILRAQTVRDSSPIGIEVALISEKNASAANRIGIKKPLLNYPALLCSSCTSTKIKPTKSYNR